MAKIRALKRLGQHFLRDREVIARMVAAIAPQPDQEIVEIGPGLGALTLPVLTACGKMTAIERDPRMLAPLAEKAQACGALTIVHEDVLRIRFSDLIATPIRVIGNLPYNLSSAILFHCFDEGKRIHDIHFMLQKEVVDRMVAAPGDKTYGRLSLMCQFHCRAEALFDVAPKAFDPPPKVNSTFVRLIPRKTPAFPLHNVACFERIVAAAFAKRRKMLRKSLAPWFGEKALMALSIAPTARPETLDGAAFARLANALWEQEMADALVPENRTMS